MNAHPTSSDVPKNPTERRAWVCFKLRLRGLSLRRIALKKGLSQQSLSYALRAPSARAEVAVAEALGLTPRELFPERFDDQGNRLTHTRPDKHTPLNESGNIEGGRAA